jgi:hypothetical protein
MQRIRTRCHRHSIQHLDWQSATTYVHLSIYHSEPVLLHPADCLYYCTYLLIVFLFITFAVTWPVIFLPVTVMVFKFFLSIPPFSWRLDRIRSGHQYRSLLSYCSCRRPTTTTTTPEPPKRRNTVLRRLLSLKLRAQLTPDNTVMTHTGEDIHDAIPSYDLSECSTPRKVGLTPRSDPDTPPPQNLRIMKFVEEKV